MSVRLGKIVGKQEDFMGGKCIHLRPITLDPLLLRSNGQSQQVETKFR